MTDKEKIELTEVLSGETDPWILSAYLQLARAKVLARCYPFDADAMGKVIPPKYDEIQCQIAAFMLKNRGAEGQTTHSEVDFSCSYENGDIPDSLIFQILPVARAF